MKKWLKNISYLKLLSLAGFFIFAFLLISIQPAEALSGDYNKATNGILANTDWNNLPNDFLPLSGGWLSGNLAIGTSSTSTYALNVNGTISATTFIGSLTGSVSAANVSNGAFGSNVFGGDYSFPSNVGIGVTNPGYKLDIYDSTLARVGVTQTSNNAIAPGFDYRKIRGSSVVANGDYAGLFSYQLYDGDQYLRTAHIAAKVNGTVANNSIPTDIIFSAGATDDPSVTNERMRITSGGNIGIGTTSPASKLSVVGSGSNLALYHASATTPVFLDVNSNGTALWSSNIDANDNIIDQAKPQWRLGLSQSSDSFSVSRSPAGAVRSWSTILYINSSGNVGIGTTSPVNPLQVQVGSAGRALKVYSVSDYAAIAGTSGDLFIGGVQFMSSTIPWSDLSIALGSSGRRWSSFYSQQITDNGTNVGIGTTSPSYKLDVSGGQINSSGGLCIAGDCKTAWSQVSGTSYWTLNGSNLYASNTAWNVGIGTTSPNAPLTVQNHYVVGDYNFSTDFKDSTGNYGFLMGSKTSDGKAVISARGSNENFLLRTVGTGKIYFDAGATGFTDGTADMTILDTGNVGIGTTNPTQRLEVSGSVKIAPTSGNGELYIDGSSTNNAFVYFRNNGGTALADIYGDNSKRLIFRTNGASESMRITEAGSVGIGTSNPTSARLVVTGDSTYNIDAGSMKIANVAPGSTSTDAVNRNQLDSAIAGISYWSINGTNIYASNTAYSVGIGTTNPAAKLHLSGTTDNAMIIDERDWSNKAMIFFREGGSAAYGAYVGYNALADGLQFNTLDNNAEKSGIFITRGAANVGIGTTSPSYKLDVQGGQINTSGGLCIAGDCKTAWSQVGGGTSYWALNGSNLYASSTSYNVGIGTTNPLVKLDVAGQGGASGGNAWQRVVSYSSTYSDWKGAGGFIITKSHNNNIGTLTTTVNGEELGQINWTGVDTGGNAYTQAQMSVVQDGAAISGAWGPAKINFLVGSTGGTASGMTISSSGIGISTTSPNSPLHVVGSAGSFGQLNIDSTSTANQSNFAISKGGLRYWAIYTPGANSDFRFYADPARSGGVGDIMTLANTGKVAIGTTTMTSAQLSVNYMGGSGASIDAGNSRVQNLSVATDPKDAITYGQATSTMWGILASPMIADFNLNGNDIINVNKLTVNTIDPLYNIRGTKYSTYAASVAGGVKEEYVGNLKIDTYRSGFGYENVLDFSKIEAGNDLWVWRNVVDFSPDNVQVFITPFGSFAQTYYLIKDNKIIFRSDKPVSVSYRLIGKRFDWKSWPTKALNQTEKAGLVID